MRTIALALLGILMASTLLAIPAASAGPSDTCAGTVDTSCTDRTNGSNTWCSIAYVNTRLTTGSNNLCVH